MNIQETFHPNPETSALDPLNRLFAVILMDPNLAEKVSILAGLISGTTSTLAQEILDGNITEAQLERWIKIGQLDLEILHD